MSLTCRSLFVLASLVSIHVAAQTPPGPPSPEQPAAAPSTQPGLAATGHHSTDLPEGQIRLHVLVTDKSGHPVTDLPESSFVLQDNGRATPILHFRSPSDPVSPAPTEVLLVIDAVNVGINTVEFERDQIDRFLRSNGGHLPVPVSALIFTDTTSRIGAVPTRDGNALAAELQKQTIGLRDIRRSAGFWGATERFDLSLRTLQQLLASQAARPGHKIVLWISPGWPYLSGPGIDLSSKQQNGLFRSVIEVNREFQRAQVTLYSIDPLGVNDAGGLRNVYYQSYLKGVVKPSRVDAADLSLQVLATQSGGRVTYGNNDIAKAIQNDIAEAGSFYTIVAELPRSEQPDTYHDLQVKVEAGGLTAHTTTGYYTQP